MIQRLLQAGFDRVLVLDGTECGMADAGSLLLALWAYEAEAAPSLEDAWIHPYYFASQKAYRAAAEAAAALADQGVRHRDDILLKPILNRLPCMTTGRNTLAYMDGMGSRFHVQVLSTPEKLPVTHHLTPESHGLHCGDCRRCMDACPSGAIDEEGFHRERCLRNWMMSGKPIPEELRGKMGNRLIGCDECQRCCPHNSQPTGDLNGGFMLEAILFDPKGSAEKLRPLIGVNLTIPNRVLSQACLLAGCSGNSRWIEVLQTLAAHPSPAVSEHAAWAVMQLAKKQRS